MTCKQYESQGVKKTNSNDPGTRYGHQKSNKNQQVLHNQDDKNEEKPETAGEEPNSLAIAGTKNLTLLSEKCLELVIAGVNDVCATI